MATEQQEQKVDIGAQLKKWRTMETQLILNELDKINGRLDDINEKLDDMNYVVLKYKTLVQQMQQNDCKNVDAFQPSKADEKPEYLADKLSSFPTMEDFDRDEEAELAEAKKNASNEWKISMEVENKLKEAYDQLYKQRMRMLKKAGVL